MESRARRSEHQEKNQRNIRPFCISCSYLENVILRDQAAKNLCTCLVPPKLFAPPKMPSAQASPQSSPVLQLNVRLPLPAVPDLSSRCTMATVQAPTRPQIQLHEGPFVNEPLVDFSKEENARKMRAAIEKVRAQLGREYDLVIGGKRVKTTDKIKSINPAKPSQVVGLHQKARKDHVEPAMKAALQAFESWSRTSVEERASLLFRVGDLLRERKFELCAWLVFEVSKNWAEADADIAETIDFCEFYSREALRLAKVDA